MYKLYSDRKSELINLDKYCDYTNKIINRFNLDDYVTLEQFVADPKKVRSRLPNAKGIYFVVYPYKWFHDIFVNRGTGGYFKEKNPNVDIDELWLNWVESADILYIGKAGGISKNGKVSNATLRERIIALLKFGNGKKVGHWGGRYLWQHKSSKYFRIYWFECCVENPEDLEQELIDEFVAEYNKRPYANLK